MANAAQVPGRLATTSAGWRHWNRLVELAGSAVTDPRAGAVLADSLAALLDECTPVQRNVIASQIVSGGASGLVRTWRVPPGMAADPLASSKWAAVVLLDCVAAISEAHSRTYSAAERALWRERAMRYTSGAENLAIWFTD